MAKARLDISDRSDVACLVNVFYDRVCADDMLGPIFNDIAHVDWPTRFPLMSDFWESVLFGTATFKGCVSRCTEHSRSALDERRIRWSSPCFTLRWMISLLG